MQGFTLHIFVLNIFSLLKTEKSEMEVKKKLEEQDVAKLIKEKDQYQLEISALKQELEMTKKKFDLHCLQMETEAKGAKTGLEKRVKELESLLMDSRNKLKDIEANSESTIQRWSKKENIYQSFMEFQFGALRVGFSFS